MALLAYWRLNRFLDLQLGYPVFFTPHGTSTRANMSTISAAQVNELRKKTDQPLMDCKAALTEAGGDMEKAIVILRSRNSKIGTKREANEVAEGRVGIYIDAANSQAGIVEMRCESAPSAKSEQYIALTNDIAKHVATHEATNVEGLLSQSHGDHTIKERIDECVGLIREKMIVQRFERIVTGLFGQYVHHDGTVGVLLQCTGESANDEVLRDVCAHIAAMNPLYMTTGEVPAEAISKEKAVIAVQIEEGEKVAEAKAQEDGKEYRVKKPEILEKIADGKLKTWMSETVLTEQPMANTQKYPNQTVGQALAKIGVKPAKFVRFKVGAMAA